MAVVQKQIYIPRKSAEDFKKAMEDGSMSAAVAKIGSMQAKVASKFWRISDKKMGVVDFSSSSGFKCEKIKGGYKYTHHPIGADKGEHVLYTSNVSQNNKTCLEIYYVINHTPATKIKITTAYIVTLMLCVFPVIFALISHLFLLPSSYNKRIDFAVKAFRNWAGYKKVADNGDK